MLNTYYDDATYTLYIEENYNLPLDNLPTSIKKIIFNEDYDFSLFNQPIDNCQIV